MTKAQNHSLDKTSQNIGNRIHLWRYLVKTNLQRNMLVLLLLKSFLQTNSFTSKFHNLICFALENANPPKRRTQNPWKPPKSNMQTLLIFKIIQTIKHLVLLTTNTKICSSPHKLINHKCHSVKSKPQELFDSKTTLSKHDIQRNESCEAYQVEYITIHSKMQTPNAAMQTCTYT